MSYYLIYDKNNLKYRITGFTLECLFWKTMFFFRFLVFGMFYIENHRSLILRKSGAGCLKLTMSLLMFRSISNITNALLFFVNKM